MKMKRLITINILLLFLLSILPKEVETQITETVPETVETISFRSLQESREDHIVTNNKMIIESDKTLQRPTNVSQECIDLVKQFEGCKLQAYRLDGENLYTIGFGHSGKDVKKGQHISKEEAERLLIADLQGYTDLVLKYCDYLELNQNELDALVSFTYNCGQGSLKKLTANKTRTKKEIAEHITAYTKSSSESNRNGLTKRRVAEKEMFLKERSV